MHFFQKQKFAKINFILHLLFCFQELIFVSFIKEHSTINYYRKYINFHGISVRFRFVS